MATRMSWLTGIRVPSERAANIWRWRAVRYTEVLSPGSGSRFGLMPHSDRLGDRPQECPGPRAPLQGHARPGHEAHAGGLQPPVPHVLLELHSVTLFQPVEFRAGQGRPVEERALAAVAPDEAEAPVADQPLDDALLHGSLPLRPSSHAARHWLSPDSRRTSRANGRRRPGGSLA